jgi:hypothetical protein
VSGVIRVMMIAISDMMGKPPTESVFFEKYSRIACVIDEIVNEVGSSTEASIDSKAATSSYPTWLLLNPAAALSEAATACSSSSLGIPLQLSCWPSAAWM